MARRKTSEIVCANTKQGTPVVTAYTLQVGPPPRDAEVNQYTQTQEGANPAVGYLYDENGNLKSDGSKDFFYDFKNRLVEVRNTVGGTLVAQYSHDVANRRIMKIEPTATTVFAYDGMQVVEERDGTNAITRQYVWGPGVDELLQEQTPTAAYYAHENSIGSVCALTDATGAVVERYQYDPFGNTTVTLNGNTGNRYRFHTMYDDPETDLRHTDNRAYNPRLGRWMQRDPIETWGDLLNFGNALTFVGNNAVDFSDPQGLYPQRWEWRSLATGGETRTISQGPAYGYWGGAGWSGGIGGNAPPIDSSDLCYKQHDLCWARCDAEGESQCAETEGIKDKKKRQKAIKRAEKGKKKCKADCDAQLVACLKKLPDNPSYWPKPPPAGWEEDAAQYKKWAIRWFK